MKLDKNSYNAGLDRAIELTTRLAQVCKGLLLKEEDSRPLELIEETCKTLAETFEAEKLK